ncbi:acyl-CoA N-acyltransferase [Exidia glandulosa HHB12029]|uniref:Acyl-CoA N-acyltransferase n=1 Tax=Exidia glandulosa HHB12029 TaxID=1314781 RepID=A0A165CZ36_EXIGL|nr:acyl-CoA N-acyltransferase [Exidia glandulosa HHB12029]
MEPSSASISYRQYAGDRDLQTVIELIHSELSEPYVVYTYRYFLDQWPQLCLIAEATPAGGRRGMGSPVGVIVCKQSTHKNGAHRGYIAMLCVASTFRKRGIARSLVERAVRKMHVRGATEVVLETEFDNNAALGLYEALGFIREKRLYRFYLNGKDAFRLVLALAPQLPPRPQPASLDQYWNEPSSYPPATPSPFAEEDSVPPVDVDP